jgi:hypothetical protein
MTTFFLDMSFFRVKSHVSFTYLWLYSPFAGSWSLFQFLNPIQSRLESLDGGSARRKVATYTQNNTNPE